MERTTPFVPGGKPLPRAAYLYLEPVLFKLLSLGADINAVDSEKRSVVQHAESVLRPDEMNEFLKSQKLPGGIILFFNFFLAHPVVFCKNLKANRSERVDLFNTDASVQTA